MGEFLGVVMLWTRSSTMRDLPELRENEAIDLSRLVDLSHYGTRENE